MAGSSRKKADEEEDGEMEKRWCGWGQPIPLILRDEGRPKSERIFISGTDPSLFAPEPNTDKNGFTPSCPRRPFQPNRWLGPPQCGVMLQNWTATSREGIESYIAAVFCIYRNRCHCFVGPTE